MSTSKIEFSAIKFPELTVNLEDLFKNNNSQYIYILSNELKPDQKNIPFYSGIEPTKVDQIKFGALRKELACFILNKYEDSNRRDWKHAQQRKILETVIRLLDKVSRDNVDVSLDKASRDNVDVSLDKASRDNVDVSLDMAKAYLLRTRLIRPKGFTIPPKKIEGLNKALSYLQSSEDSESLFMKGLISFEMDQYGKTPDNLEDDLKNATKQIADPLKETYEKCVGFYKMLVRLEELKEDKLLKSETDYEIFNDNIFQKIFDIKEAAYYKYGLELEKFKIALQSKYVSEELTKKLSDSLLERLETCAFSHHLWDDTVRFITRLFKLKKESWKEYAILLWEIAEKKAAETYKNATIHLRWYWARQRDLYDLAFLAALDESNEESKDEQAQQDRIKKAAEIADSLKNKPAITWKAMEGLSEHSEGLKQEIENYKIALGGGYVKALGGGHVKALGGGHVKALDGGHVQQISLKYYRISSKILKKLARAGISKKIRSDLTCIINQKKEESDFLSALKRILGKNFNKYKSKIIEDSLIKEDKKMVIIQFYLIHLQGTKKGGYALIFDACEKKWSYEKFDFFPVWKKFIQWQSLYFSLHGAFEREKSNDQLFELCETLGNEMEFLFQFNEEKHLLFIPHDFLHRIPIHGAINNLDASNKILLFQKNCCFYLPVLKYLERKNENSTQSPPVYLQYLKKSDESIYNSIMRKKYFDEHKSKFPFNSYDVLTIAKEQPEKLVIRCHGTADAANPFYSRLLLEKDNLELIKIAVAEIDLSNTKIIFGACETDMVSPLESPIDEHISFAVIFLYKGAQVVIGTAWEAKDETVRKFITEMIRKGLDKDLITNIQRERYESKSDFYSSLFFKFYGYPKD